MEEKGQEKIASLTTSYKKNKQKIQSIGKKRKSITPNKNCQSKWGISNDLNVAQKVIQIKLRIPLNIQEKEQKKQGEFNRRVYERTTKISQIITTPHENAKSRK